MSFLLALVLACVGLLFVLAGVHNQAPGLLGALTGSNETPAKGYNVNGLAAGVGGAIAGAIGGGGPHHPASHNPVAHGAHGGGAYQASFGAGTGAA